MSVLPSLGPTRRRTFTMNVIVFMGLGASALAYLIFVGARPDLITAWRDKPNEAQTAIAETQRTVERALADLDPIKQGVGEMKMDVQNMKTGMQEAMERDRILLTKVETLERATAQTTEKVAAAPPATPKKVAPAQAAAKPAAAAAPAKSIETGSIEPPKAAAPAKPAPVGVLLATGPSLDSLRLSWQILNDRHGASMKALQPRYVVSGKAEERTYGLVAGPLETVADAKSVCKTMTDNGITCEVSQYRGNAF